MLRQISPVSQLRASCIQELTLAVLKPKFWGEIKTKAPNKVNTRRDKLHPAFTQTAQQKMEDIDLTCENIRGGQMRDEE